jgi:hypothetical protein
MFCGEKMKTEEIIKFLKKLKINPRIEKNQENGRIDFFMSDGNVIEALECVYEDYDEVIDRFNLIMDNFFEDFISPILVEYQKRNEIGLKEIMYINRKIQKVVEKVSPIEKHLANRINPPVKFDRQVDAMGFMLDLIKSKDENIKKCPCCGGIGGEHRIVTGPLSSIFEECWCCEGTGWVTKDFDLKDKSDQWPRVIL